MKEKEIRRKRMSAAIRERRRKKRKKRVIMARLALGGGLLLILTGGIVLTLHYLPELRVARQLKAASVYVESQDYEEAIASCQEALEIDSSSVKAYRAMAGVYRDQDDWAGAGQVLYRGWETTRDESLLQEYCVNLLNDAVADINGENCSFETLDKSISALEQDTDSADAYRLLDACYVRLMGEESSLFCAGESAGEISDEISEENSEEKSGESGSPLQGSAQSCSFGQYRQEMERLLSIYEKDPSKEQLREEILKFAVPEKSRVELEVRHLGEYRDLLARAALQGAGEELSSLIACLDKAIWVQDTFREAFEIFESGSFEAIRDFMQSQTYVSIRDQFIAGTMEYWEGQTYIPVSRERMSLVRGEDGGWKFSFADFEEYPATAGIVNVWGAKHEDAGVQRLCISYEPAAEGGEYYPHKTYEFVYLYSNVKIGNEYVPQMNYRFETRVETPEGMTSELIGDWGGEHEWMAEY